MIKQFDPKKDLEHKLNSASLSTYNEFMIDLYTNKCDQTINIDTDEDTNQKELIEQDLDSQPDNLQLDEFISTLEYPEVIPSCKTYEEWILNKFGLPGFVDSHLENEIQEYNISRNNLIKKLSTEEVKLQWNNYIQDYRKELREWYLSNPKNKLFTIRDMEHYNPEAAENR